VFSFNVSRVDSPQTINSKLRTKNCC
jgi:hypothetical protein